VSALRPANFGEGLGLNGPRVGFRLLMAVVVLPAAVFAQKASMVRIIPSDRWTLTGSQALDLAAVQRWGGDPQIEAEYGVKSVSRRTYRLEETGEEAEAIFEEAQDPTGAYGLFTYYCTENMTPDRNLPLTFDGATGALMSRGPFFIRVLRPEGPDFLRSSFSSLLRVIGGGYSRAQLVADLPALLPASGLIPGTLKYLLGPEAMRHVVPSVSPQMIGFEHGAEAQVGTYTESPPSHVRLRVLAVNYPTPQMARERFESLSKALNLNQTHAAGSIYGRRQGSFILMVLDARSRAIASRFLEQFSVSRQVSWDARYPGKGSLGAQLESLLVANALLVLIVIGFSIGGGFVVFGFMRLSRKWFPQWELVQADEGRLTTLHLQ
jgi:hypothetical protein